MPGPHESVETSAYYPDHSDHKFPIGEVVTVLCHFTNNGEQPINITAIMGSLNSPFDFNYHIQNYSYRPFGVVVKPGEEMTFDYPFQPHHSLEPVEYNIAHTIFYELDKDEYFSSTFFNQTVEFYSPTSDYDFESIMQILFAVFATTFVIFLTYTSMNPDYFEKLLPKLSGKKFVQTKYKKFDDDK